MTAGHSGWSDPERVAILGAGQGGRAIKRLLRSGCIVVVWLDNDPSKWQRVMDGAPVDRPENFANYWLDRVITGTLNRDSAAALESQIRSLGFRGPVDHGAALKKQWDLRLAVVRLMAEEIENWHVSGAIAELGVYKGELARELNTLFPERPLLLFDTFCGFPEEDLTEEADRKRSGRWDFSDTSLDAVMAVLPHPEQVRACPGYFPDTIPEEEYSYALVSLDADLYKPTLAGLDYFYPRLSVGGTILIHDYNSSQFDGVHRAVTAFCKKQGCRVLPLGDFHGTAALMKQGG